MTESLPTREYPGMGLKLRYWCPENMSRHLRDKPTYPIAAHTESCYLISPIIYVREAAMMIVMETLTDKAEWHKKVFDDVIVARWRKEALAIPDEVFWDQITSFKTQDPADQSEENEAPELKPVGIMSEKAFDWCVEELRAKARHFEETGVVVTLDLGASVAKSDTLVTPELHAELQASFAKLKADQASTPDWHPKTDEKVQNLVHPSMYPLVYGRTRVLRQEVVGVADAIDLWAGKGDVLPKCTGDPAADALPFHSVRVPSDFWSDTFQWLPSNVAFHDDGGIRFTSYINNLHPQKYPRIYRALERLIATSIPLWEQCLTEFTLGRKIDGPGQRSARIPQQDKEQWDPANMEECADMEVDPGLLEPGEFDWHEQVYGTFVTDDPQSACLQNYGSVETKQGRLLAFPNVFQHRVSSFRLADPTKPGHRRFVALWLVDPHKRIISTANVPPQQRSWWAESVLGVSARARKEVAAKFPPEVLRLVRRQAESAGDKLSGKGVGPGDEATTGPMAPRLPEELVQMIQDHSKNDDMLMSEEEARKHRLALMAERSRYNTKANDLWNEVTYNFCEH
ncbi:hypothetical protein RB595_001608 [Gaeumannomyces hyphopodioides]